MLNDATTANRLNASSVAAASEAEPSSGAHQPDPPRIGRPESDDSAAQHLSAEAGPTWDGSLEAPMPAPSDAQLPGFVSDSHADALPSTAQQLSEAPSEPAAVPQPVHRLGRSRQMSLPIPSVAVMSEDVAKGQITRYTLNQLRDYLRKHLSYTQSLEKSKPALVALVDSESRKAGMLTYIEWPAHSFYWPCCALGTASRADRNNACMQGWLQHQLLLRSYQKNQ